MPRNIHIDKPIKCSVNTPKIYLDTTVLKFSATKLQRLMPKTKTFNFGDITQDVVVHEQTEINPNENITNNPELKKEAELLPYLAELGKDNTVGYYLNLETRLESWGLPNMDSANGLFFGCPTETGECPIWYSRPLSSHNRKMKEVQFDFLSGIQHDRFTELKKITGAYQGKNATNRNQLLDAFHIWCAEHNKCDYFLTLDFKLIREINKKPSRVSVKVVSPLELITQLGKSKKLSIRIRLKLSLLSKALLLRQIADRQTIKNKKPMNQEPNKPDSVTDDDVKNHLKKSIIDVTKDSFIWGMRAVIAILVFLFLMNWFFNLGIWNLAKLATFDFL